MENAMRSIGQYITNNLTAFGLSDATELHLVGKSKDPLLDGAKRLIVLALRNIPGWSRRTVPFGNLQAPNQKAERFELLLQVECKMRAADPSQDFYWNEPRKFRDKVYQALAGTSKGGVTIDRKAWDADQEDPENPVYPTAGKIRFVIDPERSQPIEDSLEDPEDPANKSIILTYTVQWWRPA